MLRIVIIEDEALAASKLERLVLSIEPEAEIVEKISSVKSAVSWLSRNSADLIFLDINLSDDLSFKIFQEVEIDIPVIFTTAYDEYAIKAFELNAVSYLLKPIDEGELRKALGKFKKHFVKEEYSIKVESLLNFLQREKEVHSASGRVIVSYGGKMRGIDHRDIAVIYSSDKVTWLYTKSQTKYVLEKSLDAMEKELPDSKFFRVNRKFMVHDDVIQEIIPFSSRKLKVEVSIDPPEMIVVPTEKITRFKEWFRKG